MEVRFLIGSLWMAPLNPFFCIVVQREQQKQASDLLQERQVGINNYLTTKMFELN